MAEGPIFEGNPLIAPSVYVKQAGRMQSRVLRKGA